MNKLHKFKAMNAWFTDADSHGWEYLGSYDTLVARVNRHTCTVELFALNVGCSCTTSKQVTAMLWELFNIDLPSSNRRSIERDTIKHGMDTGELFPIPNRNNWFVKTNYYGDYGTKNKAMAELNGF